MKSLAKAVNSFATFFFFFLCVAFGFFCTMLKYFAAEKSNRSYVTSVVTTGVVSEIASILKEYCTINDYLGFFNPYLKAFENSHSLIS